METPFSERRSEIADAIEARNLGHLSDADLRAVAKLVRPASSYSAALQGRDELIRQYCKKHLWSRTSQWGQALSFLHEKRVYTTRGAWLRNDQFAATNPYSPEKREHDLWAILKAAPESKFPDSPAGIWKILSKQKKNLTIRRG